MDEASRDIFAVWTPRGLLRPTRLQFCWLNAGIICQGDINVMRENELSRHALDHSLQAADDFAGYSEDHDVDGTLQPDWEKMADDFIELLPPQLFVYCPWSDLPELHRSIDSNRVIWMVNYGARYFRHGLTKDWLELASLRDEATREELSQAEWILHEGLCREAGEGAQINAMNEFRNRWKYEKFKFDELLSPDEK